MRNPESRTIRTFRTALVAAAFALAFSGCGAASPVGNSNQPAESAGEAVHTPANPPTDEGYENATRAALADFLEKRPSFPDSYDDARADSELVPLRAARSALADVVVTSERRDAHLKLVLALARIEQGMADRDPAVWRSGESALDSWLETESWASGSSGAER